MAGTWGGGISLGGGGSQASQGGFGTGGAIPLPPLAPGSAAVGEASFTYCPQGTSEVPPAATSGNVSVSGGGRIQTGACPEGSIRRNNPNRPGGVMCCKPSYGGGGIDLGGIGGGGGGRGPGGGGGGAGGGNVERPNLTPIDPQAGYDPEMAKSLASMRAHEQNLEQGTGRVMDVMTQRQADDVESQIAQARAAAERAGIPFDEAAFRANAQKGLYGVAAQTAMERERQLGEQLRTTGQMAGAQAEERTKRQELDYRRDVSENELVLDRYGRDIQKYGIDVQAATAANNALLAFYSQLRMLGNMGNSSMSSSNSYYYG